MTPRAAAPVLVTGSTGRLGSLVVDELLAAGTPVRGLTSRPEEAVLPAAVEVVSGDLTVPDSLEPAVQDASAVFLVWTVPFTTAPEVVDLLARRATRVVFLSAPHRTPDPACCDR